MNLNIACGIALGISLFLLVFAVLIGVKLHRAERENTALEGARRVLTPFQLFLLCFFFAAVAVFFPIYFVDYLAGESGFLKVVKAFLLAVQNVLRLVTLNGEFDNIRDFLADGARVNAALASVYSIYIAIIFVAAPLLTAGFVLSFFRDASAMLRYSLRPCRELYVMSELNERSLALARDIFKQGGHGKIVIFADVIEDGAESHELIFSAWQLGAICVKKDVTDLGLKFARRKCKRKIYLIGEDEDENIAQALTLIDRHRGKRLDSDATEFYVFSTTAGSQTLLDSADNGKMKVRRINENRNLALAEMQKHTIFSSAVKEGDGKAIRAVIVGAGGYGRELLEEICCLGQMPGYTVAVDVFDKEDAESAIKAAMPEFLKMNGCKDRGEAQYKITFHKIKDVRKADFLDAIDALPTPTGVYVTLGEDERNIETAIRIRTVLQRKTKEDKTPIYAVVYNSAKANIMAKSGLMSMDGGKYNIICIGSLQGRYSLENIEQNDLEKVARELHMQWAETDSKKKEEAEKFERFEYFRRSSMMQAVYRALRIGQGYRRMDETTPEGKANNDLLRLYEHRRWNTFMRCEGYVAGEEKSYVAKTHPLLVPFDKLSEKEKHKDDF